MNLTTLLYFSSFALMMIGFYAVLTQKNIFRLILALGLMEGGVNLLLITTGYRKGVIAPIITKVFDTSSLPNFADPLPQALVLTSIVIGLGVTALSLTLAIKYKEHHGTLDLEKIQEDKEEVVE